MGGDKYNNGGFIDVNDDWASGIDLGAKAVGFAFGGPSGMAAASTGSKMLFGEGKEGTLSKINKGADYATMAVSAGSAMNGGANAGGAEGALKGLSGKEYATVMKDGNQFLTPEALASANKANGINSALTGAASATQESDILGNMRKGLDLLKQFGQAGKQNDMDIQMSNQLGKMDGASFNINTPQMAMSPSSLNQIIGTQLMNPAKDRLAFRRFYGK